MFQIWIIRLFICRCLLEGSLNLHLWVRFSFIQHWAQVSLKRKNDVVILTPSGGIWRKVNKYLLNPDVGWEIWVLLFLEVWQTKVVAWKQGNGSVIIWLQPSLIHPIKNHKSARIPPSSLRSLRGLKALPRHGRAHLTHVAWLCCYAAQQKRTRFTVKWHCFVTVGLKRAHAATVDAELQTWLSLLLPRRPTFLRQTKFHFVPGMKRREEREWRNSNYSLPATDALAVPPAPHRQQKAA